MPVLNGIYKMWWYGYNRALYVWQVRIWLLAMLKSLQSYLWYLGACQCIDRPVVAGCTAAAIIVSYYLFLQYFDAVGGVVW